MDGIEIAERRLVPDRLIRAGIRQLLRRRLQDEHLADAERHTARYRKLLEELRHSPLAIETDAANEQHYEVPAEFFKYVLGEHLKYSACYWGDGTTGLGHAEEQMLDIYLRSAQIEDGQDVLELGCGWGSLTLWMAQKLPAARITAVSNSTSQRRHIEDQARLRGLSNVHVITCDVNELSIDRRFDRVVSVEMFEHVRNYRALMNRIATWLNPGGKLFVHIFCHRLLAYPFEAEGSHNWMGRYFFTGGLMPARDTLLHFQEDLRIEKQWDYSGTHYRKTADAWLANLDEYQEPITRLMADLYGKEQARIWVQRWRMFFMACSELFGYDQGNQWLVAHYRFTRS